MEWLKELFWLSAKHNFHLSARHVQGCHNVLADLLSRLSKEYSISHLMSYIASTGTAFTF